MSVSARTFANDDSMNFNLVNRNNIFIPPLLNIYHQCVSLARCTISFLALNILANQWVESKVDGLG